MIQGNQGGKLRLVVLISGSGRTLHNFIDLANQGELPVEIVLVISSLAGVKGVSVAEAAGIKTVVIRKNALPEPAFSQEITAAIDAVKPDLICLAGYLCKWEIPPQYENKVMNIHPALLPKYGGKGFFGHYVHEAVLAAGEKESGCTVHFANNDYDAGPIILQRKVPVEADDTPDTLAARVFEQENLAFPEAIRLYAEGRVHVENGAVIVDAS